MNATGTLSTSFLFKLQNVFWRFLATMSFVSGGTVWDYELFSRKYKSYFYTFRLWGKTVMDMRRFLPASFSRVYSLCSEEQFHGKRFLSKKMNISSPPAVERKHFSKFGRSVSQLLTLVGSTCPGETFEDIFLKKERWYSLTLTKFFSEFWHKSFAIFFGTEFNRSSRRFGGEFFCVPQNLFLWYPGNWAKVSWSIDDIFSEFFSKVHLTCPKQLIEVEKSFPKSQSFATIFRFGATILRTILLKTYAQVVITAL